MAGATTTIIRSITLSPGEQFVLPAGARLLGADVPGNITSNCELPVLEELACYGFILLATTGADGSETEVLEDTQITYLGIKINDVYTPFPTPIGFNAADVLTGLEDLPMGSMFMDGCISQSSDLSRQSYKLYVIFKTIPSIGDKLMLVASTTSPNAGAGLPQVQYLVPAVAYDTIISDGNTDLCECEVAPV